MSLTRSNAETRVVHSWWALGKEGSDFLTFLFAFSALWVSKFRKKIMPHIHVDNHFCNLKVDGTTKEDSNNAVSQSPASTSPQDTVTEAPTSSTQAAGVVGAQETEDIANGYR